VLLNRIAYRRIVALDYLVIAWCLLCLLLGIWSAKRINQLGALGDGLVTTGNSISGLADWIGGLGDTPFVGAGFDIVAGSIGDLGESTAEKGQESKDAVWRVALVVGILFVILPTAPVLAFWVPARVSAERERRSLRDALRAGDPAVWEYLARQAADDLPFGRLQAISADPWEEIRQGRYEALARVELDRLDLTPVAGEPPVRGG
jgi:hypothetical protein